MPVLRSDERKLTRREDVARRDCFVFCLNTPSRRDLASENPRHMPSPTPGSFQSRGDDHFVTTMMTTGVLSPQDRNGDRDRRVLSLRSSQSGRHPDGAKGFFLVVGGLGAVARVRCVIARGSLFWGIHFRFAVVVSSS